MTLYSALVSGSAALVALWIVACAPRMQRASVADALLLGVLLALAGGRALHVLLHWGYFQDHTAEIVALRAGGLAWQGALLGGLAGVWLGRGLRRVQWEELWRWIALSAPLVGTAAWLGCLSAACAYGREVGTLAEYPPHLARDLRDIYGLYAPRYNVQALGAGLMLLVAGVVLCGWRLRARLMIGLSVVCMALVLLALGALRGDSVPLLAGVRLDQWLNAGVLLAGAALLIPYRRRMISSV